ncbi:IS3 family transposase [Rhodococcus globerulus]|uniref:IS3 family transposase n=1 Tax=Rhodococcus globerulus TaxID=33008 RepID=UPI00374E82AB
MRRQWLTGLIREVHTASRQTYGSRLVHVELTRGMDIVVSENLVAEPMRLAGIVSLPGPAKVKRFKGVSTADDLVHRKFPYLSPNKLWVNYITEHPSPRREGVLLCFCLQPVFGRSRSDWSSRGGLRTRTGTGRV